MPDSCRNDTKGGAREDVGVVSLTGLKPLSKPWSQRHVSLSRLCDQKCKIVINCINLSVALNTPQ